MNSQSDLNDGSLGTLEFCNALNGDDPMQALSFLRRFVKTIRREKVQALSEDDDTPLSIEEDIIEESDDDSSVSELQQPPSKKAKVEAWKLDTKAYNVPFVGTSTCKGPHGTIEKGTWPTGFLEAYLKQSPNAIEILGRGGASKYELPLVPPSGLLHQVLLKRKENSGKLISSKIFELYIQALGEIVTCGIPLKKLQKDIGESNASEKNNGNNNSDLITAKLEINVEAKASYEQIISTVMKEHLVVLLNVLNSESANYGKQSYLLVEAVLWTLANLALTSVGAAREISRELDSSLKEGILQRIVGRSFSFGNIKNTKEDASHGLKYKLNVQAALLRLSSILIECGDSYITSYSISPGVKETKTKPGIAYFVIRRVASAYTFQTAVKTERLPRVKKVLNNLQRFYQSIRSNILTTNDDTDVSGRLSLNSVVTFLQGDVLETITKNMLFDTQNRDCSKEFDSLKLECQIIMTAILADSRRSPFLKQIHSERSTLSVISSCASMMIRCIQVILSCSNDAMEARTFVLHCLRESPVLFSRFLRVVQVSEPTPSFSTISMYSLVTYIIDHGPQIWNAKNDRKEELSVDKVIMHILPKGLTKNVLTKTLQCSNPLLTVECLKTVHSILNRFRRFMLVAASDKQLIDDCIKVIFRRLPDLQVFLSVRAKFDPFLHVDMGDLANVVTINICALIKNYTSIFLNTLSTLQFDWMKLLPDKTKAFCSASLIVQSRLLTTIASVLESYQLIGLHSNSITTSNAFRTFASIMMETSDLEIYHHVRVLSIKVLECITGSSTQGGSIVFHEINSWVDGLDRTNLNTFCKLLDATQKITVQHPVIISNACQQLHLPTIQSDQPTFTPALSTAIISLASNLDFFCDSFIIFVCQVTFMTLLQSIQPQELACVVQYLFKKKSFNCRGASVSARIEALVQYSVLLISGDDYLLTKACIFNVIIFQKESICTKVSEYLLSNDSDSILLDDIYKEVERNQTSITASLVIRQCFHHYRFDINNQIDENKLLKIFCRLYHILMKERDHFSIVDALLDTVTPLSKLVILVTLVSATQGKDCESKCLIEKHLGTSLGHLNATDGSQLNASKMLVYIPPILEHAKDCRTGKILQPILDYCINRISSSPTGITDVSDLLNAVLKSAHKESIEFLHDMDLQSLFKLWKVITETERNDKDCISVLFSLEALIEDVLLNYEEYGIASAYLVDCIHNAITISDDLLLCSAKYDESGRFHLLTSLVSYDASKLYNAIEKYIQEESVNYGGRNWGNLVPGMIIQGHLQKSSKSIPLGVMKAAIDLFQQKMKNNENESFGAIIQAIESMVEGGNMSMKDFGKILKRASTFLQRLRKIRKGGGLWLKEMELLKLMSATSTSASLIDARNSIVTLALVHISSSLLKVLKSNDNSVDDLATFLSINIEMLKLSGRNIFEAVHVTSLKKMMIACLKFGIDVEAETAAKCLVIVKIILEYAENEPNKILTEDLLKPHQIFAMATSHSNFRLVAAASHCPAHRELLGLLICCVTFDGKTINMDWDCISALLVGFNASPSYEDHLFRRFLYLYETSKDGNITLYKQSNFVWGQAQQLMQSKSQDRLTTGLDNGGNWEPFIESLDIKRVRQTIADFPLYETAKPQEDDGSCTFDVSKVTAGNDDGIKSDTCDDERYSLSFIMPLLLGLLESFARITSIEETKNKEAYEKASSESEAMDLDEDVDYSLSDRESGFQYNDHLHDCRESFAKVVYRLCQKGAVSLSLACLSSRCQDIRKIAVSTLYYFLKAVQMKESHDIGQWRERPQLEMILNSVQRGLVVAKVKLLQQEQGDTSSKSLTSVPMLPSVSAIFLARSIFIVSKPGDSMFSSINKYFLRIEDYHGAYNDCFSLPAFMIMFCSVNDDNSQARRERLWALQLLKDGIIDEYSYKVVSRRHVPGLLLSSFDGFCSRKPYDKGTSKSSGAYDTECFMIIEVIGRCLRNGGYTAYNHFMNVIGIFPWIQSMFELHLKSKLINDSFFEMILYALQATERHQMMNNDKNNDEGLPFDAMNLLNSVLGAYDTIVSCDIVNTTCKQSTLLKTICDIARQIHQLHKNNEASQDLYKTFQIHCNGVAITTASSIAKKTKTDISLHRNVIEALCYFPIAMDMTRAEDRLSLANFTKSALSLILNKRITSQLLKEVKSHDVIFDMYLHIMKRINFFVSNCTSCSSPSIFLKDVEVAEMLVSCRRKMLHAGQYELWLDTICGILPKSRLDIDFISSSLFDEEKKQKLEAIIELIEKEKVSNHI